LLQKPKLLLLLKLLQSQLLRQKLQPKQKYLLKLMIKIKHHQNHLILAGGSYK
jgi:hypothetical protein